MANFFLDPEGGNDANDGTTFANRWKTISSGATAPRIAPGDIIRMMASRDPASLGNATWTDNSQTVTLAGAKTANVATCDSAWTASANVTATASTTRKEGTNSASLVIAGAFTTGKVAYFALGSAIDFSAYNAISFMFRSNSAIAAGAMTLNLCLDTIGAVSVNSIAIPAIVTTGVFQPIVIDTGGALGSAIQSISINCASDPGSITILVDNIIACKAMTDNDHLSHVSLIGKKTTGEPEWYAIQSINGTTVLIGGQTSLVGATGQPYRGTTETVTTYRLIPTVPPWTVAQAKLTDVGSVGQLITYSGGWDRTAMSSQSGETWLSGKNDLVCPFDVNGQGHIGIEKLGFCHTVNGILLSGNTAGGGLVGSIIGVVDTVTAVKNQQHAYLNLTIGYINQFSTRGLDDTIFFRSCNIKLNINRITGGYTSSVTLNSPVTFGAMGYGCKQNLDVTVGRIDNNLGYGVSALAGCIGRIKGCTLANNNSGDFYLNGTIFADRCNPTSSTLSGSPLSTSHIVNDQFLYLTNVNGDATDFRTIGPQTSVRSAIDQRHTASGVSLKIAVTATPYAEPQSAFLFPIAKILCVASKLVTVTAYVRRTDTNLAIGIMTPGGLIDGVSETYAWASGLANAWEQLTITFTPTQSGVVEIFGSSYSISGITTANAWVDDFDYSQAP